MMCFRDRTFCTTACGCRECGIRLTDLIRAQAEDWGKRGGHPPLISQADRSNGCPDFVPAPRQ